MSVVVDLVVRHFEDAVNGIRNMSPSSDACNSFIHELVSEPRNAAARQHSRINRIDSTALTPHLEKMLSKVLKFGDR